MRLWHLSALVAVAAVVLAIVRSPFGLICVLWSSLFLVMCCMDSADRRIRKEHPEWRMPYRGMLVLAGATLYVTALALTLKLAIGYLSF
jgi:hypothetical protein